jgi:hypothetical protein
MQYLIGITVDFTDKGGTRGPAKIYNTRRKSGDVEVLIEEYAWGSYWVSVKSSQISLSMDYVENPARVCEITATYNHFNRAAHNTPVDFYTHREGQWQSGRYIRDYYHGAYVTTEPEHSSIGPNDSRYKCLDFKYVVPLGTKTGISEEEFARKQNIRLAELDGRVAEIKRSEENLIITKKSAIQELLQQYKSNKELHVALVSYDDCGISTVQIMEAMKEQFASTNTNARSTFLSRSVRGRGAPDSSMLYFDGWSYHAPANSLPTYSPVTNIIFVVPEAPRIVEKRYDPGGDYIYVSVRSQLSWFQSLGIPCSVLFIPKQASDEPIISTRETQETFGQVFHYNIQGIRNLLNHLHSQNVDIDTAWEYTRIVQTRI